ncbi:MAG: helix-turn-helix transcriptional regulator [Proteobacteria bacterium]|nr:helix-turn-helix transcriptional regulator [Pseudomonadota bacterium]
MAHLDPTYDLRPLRFERPAMADPRLDAAQRHAIAVERVIAFMRDNLADPLTLNDLAEIAHCSPWHFNRVFTEVTGMSPLRYLSHLRIEAAKLAVMNSDRRIIDIAFGVGYNSLGSFGKRFTELVGLAPSEWRKAVDRFDVARWRYGLDEACVTPAAAGGAALGGEIGFAGEPNCDGWAMIAAVAAGDSMLKPSACTLATVPGCFALRGLAPGIFSLVAIGFDRSMTSKDILAQQTAARGRRDQVAVHVDVHAGRAPAFVRMALRRAAPSDAPIVPPFAILAGRAAPAAFS